MDKKALGELKQKIAKINNKVNQELYDLGLVWQKVDICDNRVSILAKNRRISLLSKVDDNNNFTTRLMDLALLNEFKIKLKENLQKHFLEYTIISIMKDYDSRAELAATFIIFEEKLTD